MLQSYAYGKCRFTCSRRNYAQNIDEFMVMMRFKHVRTQKGDNSNVF